MELTITFVFALAFWFPLQKPGDNGRIKNHVHNFLANRRFKTASTASEPSLDIFKFQGTQQKWKRRSTNWTPYQDSKTNNLDGVEKTASSE